MEHGKKKLILIGAGMRGKSYTDLALNHKDKFEVVAVAEPIDVRREYIKNRHGLSDELCFRSWEELLCREKFADAAIIATMDRDHFAPAMAAIKKGYHLMLEKPIAPTPEECIAISEAAQENKVNVLVCHVLRYTPFFRLMKQIIDRGEIGNIVNVQHAEHVGNVHQSHSFVRGNWANSRESSFMLLQKACHDLDILQYLIGKECQRVQSFGALSYFVRENAPEDAPEFCIDGCPHADTCFYNAVKLYLDDKKNGWFRTSATKQISPTDADVEKALRTTNYGRCVYKCSNDVVDHQIVNLEFEDGITANSTMCAFNKGSRNIRIMGTRGEIIANMGDEHITLYEFSTRKYREIKIADAFLDESINGGHGGGDPKILEAFYSLLNGESASESVCGVSVACRNHMIAFAAEASRTEGRIVDVCEYETDIRRKMGG